jgi:hypothetical protein
MYLKKGAVPDIGNGPTAKLKKKESHRLSS